MTYFDTAYILKCYVKEHGWEQVRAFAHGRERIACSIYGRLELHAALHRKLREGEVTEQQLKVSPSGCRTPRRPCARRRHRKA